MVQDFVHQQYVNINKYYIYICIRVRTPPGLHGHIRSASITSTITTLLVAVLEVLVCIELYIQIYTYNYIYACNVDMSIIIFMVNIDHEIMYIYI